MQQREEHVDDTTLGVFNTFHLLLQHFLNTAYV